MGRRSPCASPQDPGQAGKSQVTTYARLLRGWDVDGIRESGDKLTRAGAFAAQVRRGLCRVVAGPHVHAYFEVMEGFPTAVHDDDVDASSGAYIYLISSKEPIKPLAHTPYIRR